MISGDSQSNGKETQGTCKLDESHENNDFIPITYMIFI